MENNQFNLMAGSTPGQRGSNDLYQYNLMGKTPEQQAEEAADVPQYTNNPKANTYIHSLPESEREAAIQRLTAPITGEEIARIIDANKSYRFKDLETYARYEAFRENEKRSLLSDFADAAGGLGDLIGNAISEIGENPGDAALKAIPSVIEGGYQAGRETLGLLGVSANPDSVVFKFRNALFNDGTIEDRMQQTNSALAFLEESDKLAKGETTHIIDKDFVNVGMTQLASIVADPTALIPFAKAGKIIGVGAVASKGARAVGFGLHMAEIAAKVQAIKTGVLSGAIKWGAGMPLDAVGGAVKGTIDTSINSFGKVVEFGTGLAAKDVTTGVRMIGGGLGAAGAVGAGPAVATGAATAYFAGGAAQALGEALALTSEQIRKNSGHRGLKSYAKQALEETKDALAKQGGALNPAVEKALGFLDRVDPFFSYVGDAAEGAAWGSMFGAGLGYLNDNGKGAAMGAGSGFVGGAFGAGLGRVWSDVRSKTYRERTAVSAEFYRRAYGEKDPSSGRSMAAARYNPLTLADADTSYALDKLMIAIAKHDVETGFKMLSTDEYIAYKKYLDENGLSGGDDPNPLAFHNSDGFTIFRDATGRTEILVNADRFFAKNKYGKAVVPHELLHAFEMGSSLGPMFSRFGMETILGTRNEKGEVVRKPAVDPLEYRNFVQLMAEQGVMQGRKRLAELGTGQENAAARQQIQRQIQQRLNNSKAYLAVLDKWANEGRPGAERLTMEELDLLQKTTSEFLANYHAAWFKEQSAHFFDNGGKFEGIRAVVDYIRNSYLDHIEKQVNLNEPKFSMAEAWGKGDDVMAGFERKGSRTRIGALDYLLRDMYRMSAEVKRRGSIDFSSMSDSARKAFIESMGIDDIATRDERGRTAVRTQDESPAERKARGAAATRVLEGLDPAVRQSSTGPDGVIRGPFSKAEMDALVEAGIISRGYADNFLAVQRSAIDQNFPNSAYIGYIGKQMGISATDDNLRISGKQVPYKLRNVLIVDIDAAVSPEGDFKFNALVLDMDVIERRARNVWSNPTAQNLWSGDFEHFLHDFYDKYLRNASLPIDDPNRVPSEQLWPSEGNLRRNLMHQVAGFAKSQELQYANVPIAEIPRGTMSSVMSMSVGRMMQIRYKPGRYQYDNKNAFRSVAANFKMANSISEKTPGGMLYSTGVGYQYAQREDDGITVFDPHGTAIGKFKTAKEAEAAALNDFEERAPKVFETLAGDMYKRLGIPKGAMFKEANSNIGEISPRVRAEIERIGSENVVDVTIDHLPIMFGERAFAEANVDAETFFAERLKSLGASGAKVYRERGLGTVLEIPSAIPSGNPDGGAPVLVNKKYFIKQTTKGGVKRFTISEYEGATAQKSGKPVRAATLYREVWSDVLRSRASSGKPFGTLAWHFSTSIPFFRSMTFDARFFKYHKHGIEPGFWLGASTSKIYRGHQHRNQRLGVGDEGAIRVADEVGRVTWSSNGNGELSIPMALNFVYGNRPVYHSYDKRVWMLEAIGRDVASIGPVFRSAYAMQRNGRNISQSEFAQMIGNALNEIRSNPATDGAAWNAVKDVLIAKKYSYTDAAKAKPLIDALAKYSDDVIHERTGRIMRDYASKGHDLVFFDEFYNTGDQTSWATVVPLMPGVKAPIEGQDIRPMPNVIPFWTNVNPDGTRNLTESPVRILDIAVNRGGYGKFAPKEANSIGEFAEKEVMPMFHERLEETFLHFLDKQGFPDASAKKIIDVRSKYGYNITGIRREKLREVRDTLVAALANATRDRVLLERPEWEQAQGPLAIENGRKADQLERDADITDREFTALSALDDDFMDLISNGVAWYYDTVRDIPVARNGTAYLDRLIDKIGATDPDGANQLIARLLSIGSELDQASKGMVKVEIVERQKFGMNLDGPMFSSWRSGPDVIYDPASPVIPRLTFIWTDTARGYRQSYIDRLGEANMQGFDGWENLSTRPEVRRLATTNQEFVQSERAWSKFLDQSRTGTCTLYQKYMGSAIDKRSSANALRQSNTSYESYVEEYKLENARIVEETEDAFINNLDPSVLVVDKGIDGAEATRARDVTRTARNNHSSLVEAIDGHIRLGDTALRLEKAFVKSMELVAQGRIPEGAYKKAASEFLSKHTKEMADYELPMPDFKDEAAKAEFFDLLDTMTTAFYEFETAGMNPFKDRDVIYDKYDQLKEAYRNIAYTGAFRSGLMDAVEEALAKFPTGITAQNMIKELERINSKFPVLEEARMTGFMDYLKEKALLPKDKETGKFPKLDMNEVKEFLEANKYGVMIHRDAPFDIGWDSLGNQYVVHPYGPEKVSWGNITLRSTSQKRNPAEGRNQHPRKIGSTSDSAHDVYVWDRFTVRETSDGRRILYVEEVQAQNNLNQKQMLDDMISVADEVKSSLTSESVYQYLLQKFAGETKVEIKQDIRDWSARTVVNGGLDTRVEGVDLANYTSIFTDDSSLIETALKNPAFRRAANFIGYSKLKYASRLADAERIITEAAYELSADGKFFRDYVDGNIYPGTFTPGSDWYVRMHNISTRLFESAGTTLNVKSADGTISQKSIPEYINEERARLTFNEGAHKGASLANAPVLHGMLKHLLKDAFEPGAIQEAMRMATTDMEVYGKDNWSADKWVKPPIHLENYLETGLKRDDRAISKKISEFLKSKIKSKKFKVDVGDGKTVEVSFATTASLVKAHRQIIDLLLMSNNDSMNLDIFYAPILKEHSRAVLNKSWATASRLIINGALESGDSAGYMLRSVAYDPTVISALPAGRDYHANQSSMADVLRLALLHSTGGTGHSTAPGLIKRVPGNDLQAVLSTVSPEVLRNPPENGVQALQLGQPLPTDRDVTGFYTNTSYSYRGMRGFEMASGGVTSGSNLFAYTLSKNIAGRYVNADAWETLPNFETRAPLTARVGNDASNVGFEIGKVSGKEHMWHHNVAYESQSTKGLGVFFNAGTVFKSLWDNDKLFRDSYASSLRAAEFERADQTETAATATGEEIVTKFADGAMKKVLQVAGTDYGNARGGFTLWGNMVGASGQLDRRHLVGFYTAIGNAAEGVKSGRSKAVLMNMIGGAVDEQFANARHRKAHSDLQLVPFLEGKEYFTLAGKAALAVAVRENLDGIALVKGGDGGTNSGLRISKAAQIYENLIPNFWGSAYKKLGIKSEKPRTARFRMATTPEVEKAAFDNIEQIRGERLKSLAGIVVAKTDAEAGPYYGYTPKVAMAIAKLYEAYILSRGLTMVQPVFVDGKIAPWFAETLALSEKKSSAKENTVSVSRAGAETQTWPSAMDPLSDISSALTISLINERITSKAEISSNIRSELYGKGAWIMTSWMLSPIYDLAGPRNETIGAVRVNEDGPAPDGSDFEAFGFNSQLALSGEIARDPKYAHLSGWLRAHYIEKVAEGLVESGQLAPEYLPVFKEISDYALTVSKEARAHAFTLSKFKTKDFDKQSRLEGADVNREQYEAATGKQVNMTDIYIRGFYTDVRSIPEATKRQILEKGQLMYKQANSIDEGTGSPVGDGTKAWTSGFISNTALDHPKHTNAVRLFMHEVGNVGNDGSSLRLKLVPRGTEDLGVDTREVEVEAIMIPSKRGAFVRVVSPAADPVFTAIAQDEVMKRAMTLGVSRFLDDGSGPLSSGPIKRIKSGAPAFKESNYASLYAIRNPEGRETAEMLNLQGVNLYFEDISPTGPAPKKIGDYQPFGSAIRQGELPAGHKVIRLALGKAEEASQRFSGNAEADFEIYIEPPMQENGYKTTASTTGHFWNAFKDGYREILKSIEDEDDAYRKSEEFKAMQSLWRKGIIDDTDMEFLKNRKRFPSLDNIKKLALAELMVRLQRMGVERLNMLENYVALNPEVPAPEFETPLGSPSAAFRAKAEMKKIPFAKAMGIIDHRDVETSVRQVEGVPPSAERFRREATSMSVNIRQDAYYKQSNWVDTNEGGSTVSKSDSGMTIIGRLEKYRLFGPDKKLLGVYPNLEKAKRKAEEIQRKRRYR